MLLGSFEHDPARFELFDLVIPASQPAPTHPEEATYHTLPDISHTFRPEQKLPPKAISAVFAATLLAPWPILFFLVRIFPLLYVLMRLLTRSTLQWSKSGVKVPHLFAPQVLPFTGLLAAFEALLLWYWIDLRLGQVLLYGAILAPFTAYSGKIALVAASEWRLGRK